MGWGGVAGGLGERGTNFQAVWKYKGNKSRSSYHPAKADVILYRHTCMKATQQHTNTFLRTLF